MRAGVSGILDFGTGNEVFMAWIKERDGGFWRGWNPAYFPYGDRDSVVSRIHDRMETWVLDHDWGPRKRKWLELMSSKLWHWRMERRVDKLMFRKEGWKVHLVYFKAQLKHDQERTCRELHEKCGLVM